jgi:hypothetical protein
MARNLDETLVFGLPNDIIEKPLVQYILPKNGSRTQNSTARASLPDPSVKSYAQIWS